MNDFGCRHSIELQTHFDIENRGIDYINDYFTRFEFKESHAKDLSKMFFKVPKAQLLNADFIIFCVQHKEFYVHRTNRFLGRYDFNNSGKHCCLRYNTIRRNYTAKFMDYVDLKKFVKYLDLKLFVESKEE